MSTKITEDKATYLTFMLDRETFAIPVANVREVLDLAAVTRVPRTPDFMRGVINLRGGVVPVVDMRKKFNLPDAEDTVDTCIIVVEVNVDGDAMVIGALRLNEGACEDSQIECERPRLPHPRVGGLCPPRSKEASRDSGQRRAALQAMGSA